jgi:hypothetical protein
MILLVELKEAPYFIEHGYLLLHILKVFSFVGEEDFSLLKGKSAPYQTGD